MKPKKSAPRVFVSYSHDNEKHRKSVLALTQSLRKNGIDAQIDFFRENDPPFSWPVWMEQEIRAAAFVLIVATETYARRFNQQEQPGAGTGVRWEGHLITADLYYETKETVKYIPVIFREEDARHIPRPLRLTNRYLVNDLSQKSLEPLLRHLLGKPIAQPEALGEAASLPLGDVSPEAIDEPDHRISSALTVAREEGKEAAIKQLTACIDELEGEQKSLAFYVIGQLHQQNEDWVQATNVYQRVLDISHDQNLLERAAHNLRLVIEAMMSHYGEGGPVNAVYEWLSLVKKGKKKKVWQLITPDLRLVLAQAWVWANREHPRLREYDRDDLASALSRARPHHRLARDFLDVQMREFRDTFSDWDEEAWGAASRPRRIGLDYELVLLSRTHEEWVQFGDEPLLMRPFLVRKVFGKWHVASFQSAYPRPGWPPTHEEIPSEKTNFTMVHPESETQMQPHRNDEDE